MEKNMKKVYEDINTICNKVYKVFYQFPQIREITLTLDLTRKWENLISCGNNMQVTAHWYDDLGVANCFKIEIDLNNPYPSLGEIKDIMKNYDCIQIHFTRGDSHGD